MHGLRWGALAALWLAGAVAAAATTTIDRVDPPNWWVGFREPTVQLLVHGEGVATLSPVLEYPGVSVIDVTHGASANYLFVTLSIAPEATPGRVPIDFRRDGATVAHVDYPLEARRSGSADRRGFDSRDVVYLLMPDRFANGDTSNDHPSGTKDHVDRHEGGARHGGDLAGIAAHLDYLAGMGYTQLWLTPIVENAQPAYSYHGYSITDHYRVDPRFGSNADLKALSTRAGEHGIGLIADLVINHIGSGHWWMRDLPDPAWLSTPTFVKTNHEHRTVMDPHGVDGDRHAFIDGWFDTTMPDLHPMHPPLGNYLVQNAIWWVEYGNLCGLRIDTLPYSDKRYVASFMRRILTEYPHLNIVGEEFTEDPAVLAYWQAGHANADGFDSHLPSLMDFMTRKALLDALEAPASKHDALRELYEVLADDFEYARPDQLMVLADNHDTDRLYSVLRHDDGLWRMAMAFLATTRGIPQILYGDEVLMANDRLGDDGDRRRDFPGGWAGDSADGFSGRGLAPRARAAQSYLRTLLTWRATSRAVREGALTHYAPQDDVYVYFRSTGTDRVLVALNRNTTATKLELARFATSIGGASTARDVISGVTRTLDTSVTLPPRSATILELGHGSPP